MKSKPDTISRVKLMAVLFTLLQKDLNPNERIKTALQEEKETTDFSRIRCPKCKWHPDASSRWFCSDCLEPEFYLEGCGTAWNTFETHGKCPGCNHQWRWTSCLSCSDWSLHEDWYTGAKT